MSAPNTIDIARVELLLGELRLPGVKLMWAKLAAQSDKEGWPAARFLAALAELEVADRVRRRTERHMAEAKLPPGKIHRRLRLRACADGLEGAGHGAGRRRCVARGAANVLLFGPPGGGKKSSAAALGLALVENGWRACCSRAPPTSCNGCRWRGWNWRWRPPSPSSTDNVPPIPTTSPTLPRIRPKPACSSS